MSANILVVDDLGSVRDTIKKMLERERHRVTAAASGAEALRSLEDHSFDAALVDVKMAQMDGLELLRRIRARWPALPVIMMTAYASVPSAVDAIKLGAMHYLEKPFTRDTLIATIDKARSEMGGGRGVEVRGSPFENVVASSDQMTTAVDLAKRAATIDKPVLVLGELGTGRELLARAIHAASSRANGPFLAVRCATLAGAHAQEADLFGVTSGAPGRLLEANSGTLYLDEVVDLHPDVQARLSRFLQDGEFVRSAGGPTLKADVRVIACSSRDAEAAAADGAFRTDLLHRLKSVLIRVPPLRERRDDIPRLAQHLARKLERRGATPTRFTKDALAALTSHAFPGNVKELEDLVEQALAMAPGGEIGADVLARLGLTTTEAEVVETGAMKNRIDETEKRAIDEALRRNPKNLKHAARELNISRTTLWRKMKKHGLEPK